MLWSDETKIDLLEMKRTFTLKHDNDPTHLNQQKNGFSKRRLMFLNCPDLNPIENLGDLKRYVHRRCPRKLTDLEWVFLQRREGKYS